MGKSHRGAGLVDVPNKGRGKCPICGRTGIKLLYDWKDKDDNKIKVCKICRKRDPQKVELNK